MPQVFFVCRLPASVGRRIFFVEIATRLPYCATLFQGSNFVVLYRLLSGFEICGYPHLPVAASVEIIYFSTLEFCRMAKRAYLKVKAKIALNPLFVLFYKNGLYR